MPSLFRRCTDYSNFFISRSARFLLRDLFCGIPVLLILSFLPLSALAQDAGLKKIRLGVASVVGDATTIYAWHQGWFAEEGLDVELVQNSAGAINLRQVLKGDLDIGTVAPTPIVYTAMGRSGLDPNFRIFGSIMRSTRMSNLVVLDSRKIQDVKSLKGNRIALQQGTASEFFWHQMAIAHHLDPDTVEIVNMRTPEIPQNVGKDQFDAAIVWIPYEQELAQKARTPAKIYNGDQFFTTSWLTVAQPQFIADNPEIIEGFLRVLLRAQNLMIEDPMTIALVQSQYVDASPEELLRFYTRATYHLGLTESLLINLTRQGDWAIRKGYVNQTIPDFSVYMDAEPLKKVTPESVMLLQ